MKRTNNQNDEFDVLDVINKNKKSVFARVKFYYCCFFLRVESNIIKIKNIFT